MQKGKYSCQVYFREDKCELNFISQSVYCKMEDIEITQGNNGLLKAQIENFFHIKT